MDRDISVSIKHGVLDFLDKHTLSADDVKRNIWLLIAERFHEHEFNLFATRQSCYCLGDYF